MWSEETYFNVAGIVFDILQEQSHQIHTNPLDAHVLSKKIDTASSKNGYIQVWWSQSHSSQHDFFPHFWQNISI